MGYDPENYSQAQLNELDSRNANASKTRRELVTHKRFLTLIIGLIGEEVSDLREN
jgi:hypothetical protein